MEIKLVVTILSSRLSTWEGGEEDGQEFKTSLDLVASSKPARAV